MKITELLTAEHAAFAAAFNRMEQMLPQCNTVGEVHLLARVVAGMLDHHQVTETDLLFAALDQVLGENGQLDCLRQDHQEIDVELQRVEQAAEVEEARRLLAAALQAAREHFRMEERNLFRMIDQWLSPDSLIALGQASLDRYLIQSDGKRVSLPAGL